MKQHETYIGEQYGENYVSTSRKDGKKRPEDSGCA